jgi:hypothetical protein
VEETIGYEALFSSDEWDSMSLGSWDPEPPSGPSLSEDHAVMIAESLNDYVGLAVTDLGGSNDAGYWVTVTNVFTDNDHEIRTWQDYWDFLCVFIPSKGPFGHGNRSVLSSGVTRNGSGSAARSREVASEEIHSSAGSPPAPATAAG